MKFWDTSAIVPLLVSERSTRRMQALAADDPAMLVWWASEIECVSALSRREREGALTSRTTAIAQGRLKQLTATWHEIDPTDAIREAAIRFLRVHPLRAADALHLAAAFLAAERQPPSLGIVTLDERMRMAAHREGFAVLPAAPVE
jgi:predicted nucleic acid-binding protein